METGDLITRCTIKEVSHLIVQHVNELLMPMMIEFVRIPEIFRYMIYHINFVVCVILYKKNTIGLCFV
jgi:hypothetical protein